MASEDEPSKKGATNPEVTLGTSRASKAEIVVASSLADLRKKKAKKAVKKVIVKDTPRVSKALSDDEDDEHHPSGDSHNFCCSMKFSSHSTYTPTLESEFVDIETFSDKEPEDQTTPKDLTVGTTSGETSGYKIVQAVNAGGDDASPKFMAKLEGIVDYFQQKI